MPSCAAAGTLAINPIISARNTGFIFFKFVI